MRKSITVKIILTKTSLDYQVFCKHTEIEPHLDFSLGLHTGGAIIFFCDFRAISRPITKTLHNWISTTYHHLILDISKYCTSQHDLL